MNEVADEKEKRPSRLLPDRETCSHTIRMKKGWASR